MKAKLLATTLALSMGASLAVAGPATAVPTVPTTVTIRAQNGDLSGRVGSPRPKLCGKNRKVIVYKQVGAVQDRSVDTKVGSDLASLQNGHYVWDTGNSGTFGKVYARAVATASCKADSSPTIKSVRSP